MPENMMLLDIDDCTDPRLRANICVIGSGAAGLAIATELAGGPQSVIVLESGGLTIEPATQGLYRSETAGLAHGGIHELRFRVFGGTTTRWAGQALPLLDIDFTHRSWIPYSGWPLRRSEFDPYYERACRMLKIPPFPSTGSNGKDSPISYDPAFDRRLLVPIVSRFSRRPNLATSHGRHLASCSNVRVVLHANVTELVSDPAGSTIDAARARALSGKTITVEAESFVVCAGGIETPRLLLVSDRYADGGLGNSHDLVGRFFQDHPAVVVGPIQGGDRPHTRETFRPRRVRGIRYQPLFRASDQLQRKDALTNVGGAVEYAQGQAVQSAKTIFRSAQERHLGAEARAALRDVVQQPVPAISAAWRYFLLRQPALDTAGLPVLAVGGEQIPNPESRVYLSPERDVLGMPRLVLQWRLTDQEVRTWRRFAEVAADGLEKRGFGRVALEEFRLPDDPDDLSGIVIDAGHHIGTTRMAQNPKHGVVDRDCRVFGLSNLYIASSAVFPTGGFSNPTLTIVALAIRLADRLRGQGSRERAAGASQANQV
jgi:choline dehydrogenase-like flavoprotein